MPGWLWPCADCGREVRVADIHKHGVVCEQCSVRRKRLAGIVMEGARQAARERQARIEAVLA